MIIKTKFEGYAKDGTRLYPFDKGSSAPPAPDPREVSSAQTQSNLETARANARINRPGQKNAMTIVHIRGSDVEAKLYSMLQSNIDAEVTRATAAEGVNAAAIATETARATAAEGSLDTAIVNEIGRANAAEATLTSDLAAEVTARIADVDAEETRALAAESALNTRVTALETTIDGGTY